MNRKKKKQMITTAGILLLFLVGAVWYFVTTGQPFGKQENSKELTGIFQMENQEETVMSGLQKDVPPGDVAEGPETLVVFVCGAVNEPGVYTLDEGSRLFQAVTLAGGFSAEAAPDYHNLARTVSDGERIYILSSEEVEKLTPKQQAAGEEGAESIPPGGTAFINLNTATGEQLMTLPGIGEAKAAAVLEYRNAVGQFTDIEEIMNVSGIGEAMFEKIKDKITVD